MVCFFLGHPQLIYHLKNSLFTPFSVKIHRILFPFLKKSYFSLIGKLTPSWWLNVIHREITDDAG